MANENERLVKIESSLAHMEQLTEALNETVIDKLKPFYYQQVVGMDVVATFVPMCAQLNAFTVTAERCFDYKIKERSNFQQ